MPPLKEFKIKPAYKHGLFEEAKQLIKQGNEARNAIAKSSTEKNILLAKYKKLRNMANNEKHCEVFLRLSIQLKSERGLVTFS